VIRDGRLAICVVLSVVGHFAVARTLDRLPRRQETPEKRLVSIRVVSPPPAPEPPPEPAAPQPIVPKAIPHELPRAHRPTTTTPPEAVPKVLPPPDLLPHAGDSTAPVFGVTIESTSSSGTGPSVPVGNSIVAPGKHAAESGAAKALAPPVPEYQVTTMPLPQGRCVGKYTDEAKQAAIEGTVVLDLVIAETGCVREVRVVSGLDHGLTEAAIAAVKECRFSPGERDGIAVPVRVRQFKIRFLLENAE
jgi:TonB family protein